MGEYYLLLRRGGRNIVLGARELFALIASHLQVRYVVASGHHGAVCLQEKRSDKSKKQWFQLAGSTPDALMCLTGIPSLIFCNVLGETP